MSGATVDHVNTYPRIQDIFVCVYIGEHEILLREVFESEVVEQFTNHGIMSLSKTLVEQLLREVSREEAIRLIQEVS